MIYFDHAATSLPKSKIALEAFFNAANNYANASRGSYEPSLNASRLIYQTREDIKQYFIYKMVRLFLQMEQQCH